MAGNINFTFKLGEAPSPSPVAAPMLRPYELFPTRIWQARMPSLAPHLETWVATALAMRATQPSPAGRTNRQGWNSEDMAVLDQPALHPLRHAVRAACTSALSEMGMREASFELQAWINIHDRGGFNFLHVHEGSLLSGSIYLKVPPGSGKLVFRDPRAGVVHGQIKGAVPNGYSDVQLTPEPGLLVLFPCWLEHYVEPHESDEPRIAIAFNAVPNYSSSKPPL
ncbi:MAG TPA: TIGR02466 family protein [Burkholderiaceae bacterium]